MIKKNTFFSKLKFFFLGLLFLVIFGIVVGLLITVWLDSKEDNQTTDASTKEKIETIEINKDDEDDSKNNISNSDTIDNEVANIPINDSTLLIGRDMSAGVYKLISDMPTAFYRISTTPQANFIDIKDNDVFSNFTYIKVEDDEYLTLIDARAVSIEDAPINSFEDIKNHHNVKYLVGKDIEPGSYTISPSETYGFIEISSEPISSPANIVLSSYITNSIDINLVRGQFFKVSQSKITPNY